MWLVELYEPGASRSVLQHRLRALAGAASHCDVVVVASVVVPEDEQALCLLLADTASAIRRVCRVSRFRVDRCIRVEPAMQS
jgi:hypothetical protein